MSKINKLNVNQICSVKTYINSYNKWYEYRKKTSFLFITIRKEGFYYTFTLSNAKLISNEEIESEGKYFIKNNKVYYKPHLEIKMSNGTMYEKFFDSEKELYDFMNSDIMKSVNWINK